MTLIADAPVKSGTKVATPAPAAPLSAAQQDTLIKSAAEVDVKAQVPAEGATSGDSRGWTTQPVTAAQRARAAASAATERASQVFAD